MNTSPLDVQAFDLSAALSTQWCVVTGAPCAGKTTTLEVLGTLGYAWRPEVARTLIEQRLAEGRTLAEIRNNEGAFQREQLDFTLRARRSLSPDELILFDSGLPDFLTYFRVSSLDPNEILTVCGHWRYACVFHFDPLPLVQDHARIEDEDTANAIDTWLERDYRALGYQPVRVPVMPVANRVALIVEHLNKNFSYKN